MGLFDRFRKRPSIEGQIIDLAPTEEITNISYHKTDFVGCEFVMSHRWPQFLVDCTFTNCKFTLEKSLMGFRTMGSTFQNCQFHFKRATNWRANSGERFEDCRFTGRLFGAMFGGICPNGEYRRGRILRCDFSHLNLDDIEFIDQILPEDCIFPSWPVIGFSMRPGPLPNIIQALPAVFHDKTCSSIRTRESLYVVNLGKLNLDQKIIEEAAEKTDHIFLFEN